MGSACFLFDDYAILTSLILSTFRLLTREVSMKRIALCLLCLTVAGIAVAAPVRHQAMLRLESATGGTYQVCPMQDNAPMDVIDSGRVPKDITLPDGLYRVTIATAEGNSSFWAVSFKKGRAFNGRGPVPVLRFDERLLSHRIDIK